jgi:hypothetical protein
MQLRMPRGQVVSPRRRGYAGNRAARQAFFLGFLNVTTVQKTGLPESSRYIFASRARPPGGANHKENNPAHIAVEEQTFDRAGLQSGDVCAVRIDFRSSRARRSWCGPKANDKSAVHRT